MKPSTAIPAMLSCLGLGFVLLGWFGLSFVAYLQSANVLVVNPPDSRQLPLSAGIEVALQGSGFDQDTRVGLVMDISNHDMVVNHYPLDGFFNTSLIQNHLLFLGSNDGLHVLSLADPASPRLLDTYLSGRSIVDLYFADGYLYVSCGRLGLVMMTLENDSLLVAAEIWTGDTVIQSRPHRGYLYVITSTGGLLVYALNEPSAITRIGHLLPEQPVRMMAFHQDHLYLTGHNNRLSVFDCSDPYNVVAIGRLDFSERVRAVQVHQDHLYVALESRVLLYALDDPRQPREVRSWDGFDLLSRIVVGRDHLYLIDRNTGLKMLNHRDFRISAQKEFSAGLQTLVEGERFLYVTGTLDGLLTIDRQRLRPRQTVKRFSPIRNVRDMIALDDTLFLATTAGLALVHPDNDTITMVPAAASRSSALALVGDRLFVGQDRQGVKVFDVGNPFVPELVAALPEPIARGLVTVGNYLVASSSGGLSLIDIADVSAPRVVDALDGPQVLGMVSEGSYLFCVTYGNGMLVLRIHEQGTMEQVAHFLPPFPSSKFDEQVDIDVHNGTAYIANGRSGLTVVDVRIPERPKLLTSVGLPGYSKGVKVHDRLVYVVTSRHGIHLVDSEIPDKATHVGNLPISRLSKSLLVQDGLLYYFQESNVMAAVPLPQFAESVTIESAGRLKAHFSAPNHPGRYSLQVSNRNGMVTRHAALEYDREYDRLVVE